MKYLWIMMIFYTTGAMGQTISGTITDAESGEKLAGANIRIANTFKATASDYEGSFKFTRLEKGTHQLVVTFIGYDTLQRNVNLQNDVTLDLELQPSALMNEEVIVTAIRSQGKTPGTYTNLDEEDIEKKNLGQDMPFIMQYTPSSVVTSDAGAGIGYTGIRIRGSDITRINVTINGIPVNDPESHGVFWVNMPDFASSVDNLQIQRGVGSSTNGAGAFGATINMQTNKLNQKAYGEISSSYGSFNSWKNTVQFGTGLINGKWAFNGRASKIASDGYIDRASSNLRSFFLSGGYYGESSILKVNVFSGKERTYQAWWGVPEAKLGTYPDGQRYLGELSRIFSDQPYDRGDRTFNYYTYDNEVDNYQQDHYQVHYSKEFNKHLNLNTALHYTYGRGYFEQFRDEDDFETYGLRPLITNFDTVLNNDTVVFADTVNTTDVIRRRWLDNHFYGATFSLNYNNFRRLEASLGGAWNQYDGDHFGEIIWARYAGNSNIQERFYDNVALKTDFNIYAKIKYQLTTKFNIFTDLQYRTVGYRAEGTDIGHAQIDLEDELHFFNPKLGLNYDLSSSSVVFAFLGISNREPTRNDYIDAPDGQRPEPETLRNIEAGYEYKGRIFTFTANAYLMDYKNQLVLTGKVNDVGVPVRENIGESYRAGLELITAIKISNQLRWNANLTMSRNKNGEYVEVIGPRIIRHTNTDISFSPSVIAGSELTYQPLERFSTTLLTKYVGEQYLDNTQNENRKIEAYLLHALRFDYTHESFWKFREVGLSLLVNNVLDVMYEANGYTFSYYYDSQVFTENYYYPQAGRNFLASVTLKF